MHGLSVLLTNSAGDQVEVFAAVDVELDRYRYLGNSRGFQIVNLIISTDGSGGGRSLDYSMTGKGKVESWCSAG